FPVSSNSFYVITFKKEAFASLVEKLVFHFFIIGTKFNRTTFSLVFYEYLLELIHQVNFSL
ncbi:MAG: hypothetical protein RBR50_07340, partial [Candidatus Izemoplasmatales bacterium]|nr:hypothetical protein [Candidatus Izemoplasmatales bacterium]